MIPIVFPLSPLYWGLNLGLYACYPNDPQPVYHFVFSVNLSVRRFSYETRVAAI